MGIVFVCMCRMPASCFSIQQFQQDGIIRERARAHSSTRASATSARTKQWANIENHNATYWNHRRRRRRRI